MASVTSGGSGGRRKRVDQEIPLIPFIDLLLCCVMFLLVTAIWNETGNVPSTLSGASAEEAPPGPERDALILEIAQGGFVLASTAGDRLEVPAAEGALDFAALDRRLAERHRLQPDAPPVKVRPDDDISADTLVATMDLLRRNGFASLSFL